MSLRGLAVAATAAVASACSADATDTVHHIVPHNVFGCPVDEGNAPDTMNASASVALTALGDFGDSPDTSEVLTGATLEHGPLHFPEPLRGAEARISSAQGSWSGVGMADPSGDVVFTVWSTAAACDLADWGTLPKADRGQAIVSFDGQTRLLVAGGEVPSDSPPAPSRSSSDASVLDLTTGQMTPVEHGMFAPRAWATATPFGPDGVLVAGGNDGDRTPRADAEVLVGGSFGRQTIALSTPRTKHAAVVDSQGRTLLVGGIDDQGKALDRIEAIVPGIGSVSSGLAFLQHARSRPIVLRLADGVILVAGGFNDSGAPVAALEWLADDGSTSITSSCGDASATTELPPVTDRAFVALAGGGALALDPSDCCDASGGCATTPTPGALWWITADHCIYGPYPTADAVCSPRLVSGADGLPWAWEGTDWQQLNPWTWPPSLTAPTEATPLDTLDPFLPAPVAVDPGLFLWLVRDDVLGVKLRGYRHSVRNAFTRDNQLLVDGPDHFVPNGPLALVGAGSFRSDGLHVVGRGVVLADTSYADVVITGRAPTGVLPRVRLGTAGALDVGGRTCPWPAPGTAFRVTRRGDTVIPEVAPAPGASPAYVAGVPCTGPEGHVAIGLYPAIDPGGALVEAIVQQLGVTRLP